MDGALPCPLSPKKKEFPVINPTFHGINRIVVQVDFYLGCWVGTHHSATMRGVSGINPDENTLLCMRLHAGDTVSKSMLKGSKSSFSLSGASMPDGVRPQFFAINFKACNTYM